jgi:hypothetical protein
MVRGLDAWAAACTGVHVHGVAGELADARRLGAVALDARGRDRPGDGGAAGGPSALAAATCRRRRRSWPGRAPRACGLRAVKALSASLACLHCLAWASAPTLRMWAEARSGLRVSALSSLASAPSGPSNLPSLASAAPHSDHTIAWSGRRAARSASGTRASSARSSLISARARPSLASTSSGFFCRAAENSAWAAVKVLLHQHVAEGPADLGVVGGALGRGLGGGSASSQAAGLAVELGEGEQDVDVLGAQAVGGLERGAGRSSCPSGHAGAPEVVVGVGEVGLGGDGGLEGGDRRVGVARVDLDRADRVVGGVVVRGLP